MASDTILINPTPEELASAVATAVEYANKGARAREVSGFSLEWARNALASVGDDSIYERTGGGVACSYRQVATTSVLGVALCRLPGGDIHARVYGSRVIAPASAGGRREPYVLCTSRDMDAGMTSAECVYPELRFDRRKKALKTRAAGFLLALAADVFDLAARAAYADWLQEQAAFGYPHPVSDTPESLRKAVARLQGLLATEAINA